MRWKTCRFCAGAVLAAILICGLILLQAAPSQAKSPVNKTFWGSLAINGFDPVAYFTLGKPVEGDERFEFKWQGAVWRFSSAGHRSMFQEEPEKYAPRYGGYCAWAVAQGYTADVDPTKWKIVDGRLYLNYDAKVQKKWEADIPGNIKRADANWPGVLK